MQASAQRRRFDFREANQERKQAMRALEAMMLRHVYAGEELDRAAMLDLLAVATGREPAVGIDLADSVHLSLG